MKALHRVLVASCLSLGASACGSSPWSLSGAPGGGEDGGATAVDAGPSPYGGNDDAATGPKGGSDGGPKGGGHDSGVGNTGDAAPQGGDDGGPPPPATGYCFGSHPMKYPSDVLMPTGAQTDLDSTTAQAYDSWKSKYVKQGCGGYYVLSGGGTGSDVGDEVSEGHGYGMVITALMACHDPDAKTIFDGMYTFFKAFPTATHQNLMAWTVNVAGGCTIPSGGSDSATDGDLDVAFSLLLADKQWPGNGYLDKAKAVIADLEDGDQNKATYLTTLGDWSTSSDPDYYATRPSDFMLDHFRAYAGATGDSVWTQGVDATYGVISAIQTNFSPTTGLLPDFVVNTNTAPQPAAPNFLEANTDGEYAYNSCRTPWRIATDYIVSSDARAKSALQLMNGWIMSATGNDPTKIMDGYTLSGGKGSGQSGPDAAFTSPFGVAAMVGTNQAWLDAIWSGMAINDGYYGDSITMLDMIVMSGNWWAP
jgi:endo-1,4-beta-D-glucanase Y